MCQTGHFATTLIALSLLAEMLLNLVFMQVLTGQMHYVKIQIGVCKFLLS